MEEVGKSKNGGSRVAIVVLAVLAAILGYLFFKEKEKTKELESLVGTKVLEITDARVALDSISRVLDEKILELEALGGNVTELERIKAELEKDVASLRSGANFSAKKYKDKIAEYERFLNEKEEEIVRLKEENGMLSTENLTLKTEKEQVISQNVALSHSKDSLINKVDEVSTKNKDLQEKVNMASALKATNVQIVGLTSRGKEKDGKLKDRRIDQLKVSFTLLANPLTEKVNKEVMLRLLDPDGATLNDMGRGGVLKHQGLERGYTIKQNVLYTNSDQKVDIYYKKDKDFKSGVYKVELYSEGFLIGTGSFEVK